MKVIVEANLPQNFKYSKDLLEKIAQEAVRVSALVDESSDKEITISLAVVDENEIRRVNKLLRGQDKVTNVLSIGEYSDQKNIIEQGEDRIFLGEVILCYNYIEQVAYKNEEDVDKEFFTIYAHGVLHLLGLSHGEDMFQKQDFVGEKFIK